MKTEFTKGVWEINKRASRNVKCNGVTIANCSGGQAGENEEEEIANAKLIATAPEMFNLLSGIIGNKIAMEHVSDDWQRRVKALIESLT